MLAEQLYQVSSLPLRAQSNYTAQHKNYDHHLIVIAASPLGNQWMDRTPEMTLLLTQKKTFVLYVLRFVFFPSGF